jgi:hypothetical protein
MVKPEQLAILNNARKNGRPWFELAWALAELEKASPVDENGRPWVQRAEAESGYSANQLRRMAKVALFRNYLIQNEPALAAKALDRPFSHLEMIGKIWKLDEGEARKLIDYENNNDTFRSLLEVYDKIGQRSSGSTPIVAGKRAAKDFREKVITLLKQDTAHLFAETALDFEIMRPIVPFRYANPDYYMVGREHGKVVRIEAIDCYALYGGSQRDTALRKIVAASAEATFFCRFWIVMPAGECAADIIYEAEELGLANVGVIVLENEKLEWARTPPFDAQPNPDRRNLWSDYDRQRLR